MGAGVEMCGVKGEQKYRKTEWRGNRSGGVLSGTESEMGVDG